ncbi:phospholipase [Psychromonas sp. psych-6C06]|uniref:patatin-like phospholipase family protein n=1 Tax=Psychromonas sp. psych-6C06 TaxID=2058089 RepID=UPI000C336A67|nr:patatin-like phospholipase family protein [Psychromonas sp. psych-6C06]PKF61567.1 phospholipase [Psychromonas sp. psych-6C06]
MKKINHLLIISMSLLVVACSTQHRIEQRTTEQNYQHATILHDQNQGEPIRFWASQQPDFLYQNSRTTNLHVDHQTQFSILALSGGGANGAFGAGVLVGLHEKGQLPDYSVITGISVGGLLAPFVFVGGETLEALPSVILNINDKTLIGKKNFINALTKDAFSQKDKMLTFIKNTYSDQMIEEIAAQHRNGKRLFIGTTHFDSGELMVWNIGAIANSELPQRVLLIHQVLAATTAIPGVFPPQFFDVNDNNEQLEEMHVDGGLATQVFFNPANFDYYKLSQSLGLTRSPRLDVIRNGKLKSSYQAVADKGIPLITKSLSSLTTLQARGDIYRMKYLSEIENIDMQFAYIDKDFSDQKKSRDLFDSHYMKVIYQYGYNKVVAGELWQTELPM